MSWRKAKAKTIQSLRWQTLLKILQSNHVRVESWRAIRLECIGSILSTRLFVRFSDVTTSDEKPLICSNGGKTDLAHGRWRWQYCDCVDCWSTCCAIWWHRHWPLRPGRAIADGRKCRWVRNDKSLVPIGRGWLEIGPTRPASSRQQPSPSYGPSKRL